MTRRSASLALGLMVLAAGPAIAQGSRELRLAASIAIPKVQGGFDHMVFDSRSDRLLLTAEDHGSVEVFDLKRKAHVRSLGGFANPHDILVRAGSPTMLVVDSGPAKSRLIEARTYRTIKQLPLAPGANCILYDPASHRLYIATGGDRVHMATSSLIAVDPDSGRVLQSLLLPGLHLQPMVQDAATHRLFVNMADKNALAVVDSRSLKLLGQWSTGEAVANSAIAFDALHHRLFVVGETGVMVVMNADTGAITQTLKVPARADDLPFDKKGRRLFIPGGDGILAIYDVSQPDAVKEVGTITMPRDARTALLIPQRHNLIVAAPAQEKRSAMLMVFDVQ